MWMGSQLFIHLKTIHFAAKKEPYSYESIRDGQPKRIFENLLPGNYFQIRYQLLPCVKNQVPQVFKTDMVTFGGVISKVYTDKYSRVIQCWSELDMDEEQNDGRVADSARRTANNTFSWKHKYGT